MLDNKGEKPVPDRLVDFAIFLFERRMEGVLGECIEVMLGDCHQHGVFVGIILIDINRFL